MSLSITLERYRMAISANERAFFERLGTRVAELRRSQNITQVEMARRRAQPERGALVYARAIERGYTARCRSHVPEHGRRLGTGADHPGAHRHAPGTTTVRERTAIGDMMSTADPSNDDEMPAEVDFSGGTRGKFYRPGATLALPVYLETEVQARLALLANAKGVDFSTLVNNMLRKDIELIETAK